MVTSSCFHGVIHFDGRTSVAVSSGVLRSGMISGTVSTHDQRSIIVVKRILMTAALLVLGAASLACAGNDVGKAKGLVDKGIAQVEVVGAEQAAKDFMDSDGGFIDHSYYLLFYTYDGTCLALGAKPEIAGKNRWNVHDPDGFYQVREMIKTAKAGGGWVEYKYANPTTGEIQQKKTWVQPVPGMDAFMGCGIY